MKTPDTEIWRSFDVHSQVLTNGLKVLLVENPVIPAIAINATVLAGARHEPEDKAGLAIMASNLLDEGTKTRSSLNIAEAIESTGGHLETDGSFERIVAAATVLKQDADLGLDLVADLLINPIFPEEYIAKEKSRTLAEIASAKDRPQVVAGWAFNELIYGTHPLHRPAQGYPETIERITRDDLLGFHEQFFAPNNAILSVVGDFQDPGDPVVYRKAIWPVEFSARYDAFHRRNRFVRRNGVRSSSRWRHSSSTSILGILESSERILTSMLFRSSIRFSVAARALRRGSRSG